MHSNLGAKCGPKNMHQQINIPTTKKKNNKPSTPKNQQNNNNTIKQHVVFCFRSQKNTILIPKLILTNIGFSGEVQVARAGSGAFLRLPAQGQVQVAGAGSGKFRKVADSSGAGPSASCRGFGRFPNIPQVQCPTFRRRSAG